jgi:carbonic anhydrase
MYRRGWSQFLPFVATVSAIVLTDLLIGVLIGLAIGIASVVRNLISTPFLSKTDERPEVGHPARIKFGQQLTFLHRARLIDALEAVPTGSELILDASQTEYIDPDVMEIIRTFRDVQCLERDIRLSLIGLRGESKHENHAQYVDVFTKERQSRLTPAEALTLMQRGNQRFASGQPLERDLMRQVKLVSQTQHPLAAVLACIDSRVPTELLFDKGLGDIFSVRVGGNVLSDEIIGSLEYAAEVSRVPLIVILGHTGCGAIQAACQDIRLGHITRLLEHVKPAVDEVRKANPAMDEESTDFTTLVSHTNVAHVHAELCQRSEILRKRIESGELAVVGALYHLEQGEVEFFEGATAAAEEAERPQVANLSTPALSPA